MTHIAASLDAQKKISAHELPRTRGPLRRAQVFLRSLEEAQAGEAVGIDILDIAMSPAAAATAVAAPRSSNIFGLHG